MQEVFMRTGLNSGIAAIDACKLQMSLCLSYPARDWFAYSPMASTA